MYSHMPFEFCPLPRHFRIEANQFNCIPDLRNIFIRLFRPKTFVAIGDDVDKVIVGFSRISDPDAVFLSDGLTFAAEVADWKNSSTVLSWKLLA